VQAFGSFIFNDSFINAIISRNKYFIIELRKLIMPCSFEEKHQRLRLFHVYEQVITCIKHSFPVLGGFRSCEAPANLRSNFG
jgi:hypothetical protein